MNTNDKQPVVYREPSLSDMVREGRTPIARLQHLLHAEQGDPLHMSRTTRDLVLQHACGESTLAETIEQAWRAGYQACEADRVDGVTRSEPTGLRNAAKTTVAQSTYAHLSALEWKWIDESAAWEPEGSDYLLRPSQHGTAVILMVAGGEYSGVVIIEGGRTFSFDEGTFS